MVTAVSPVVVPLKSNIVGAILVVPESLITSSPYCTICLSSKWGLVENGILIILYYVPIVTKWSKL